MAADNTETPGPQPAAPTGVNQELPSVDVARQNFREKVRDFVVAFKNQPEGNEISRGNGKEPIQELENFLANSALPKRDKEKKILEQMQLLQGLFNQLVDLKVKDNLKSNIEAEEAKGKISKCVNEASTAEEEFDEAYKEDKKQSYSTPGFVTGNENLYQYNGTNQKTGEKTFGVMSTVNTREGFKDALKHYAESVDEKGNSREFTNVSFGKPEVSAQQLKESAGLKNNFHKQVCDALDANLYPEKEIEKLVEALAGPSMNQRMGKSEDKLKVQQLNELKAKINDYKDAKDGKPRETGEAKASVVPGKKAEKTAKETASLSMKEKEAEKTKEAAPAPRPAK